MKAVLQLSGAQNDNSSGLISSGIGTSRTRDSRVGRAFIIHLQNSSLDQFPYRSSARIRAVLERLTEKTQAHSTSRHGWAVGAGERRAERATIEAIAQAGAELSRDLGVLRSRLLAGSESRATLRRCCVETNGGRWKTLPSERMGRDGGPYGSTLTCQRGNLAGLKDDVKGGASRAIAEHYSAGREGDLVGVSRVALETAGYRDNSIFHDVFHLAGVADAGVMRIFPDRKPVQFAAAEFAVAIVVESGQRSRSRCSRRGRKSHCRRAAIRR